ncbi:MAG: LytTR family DNA-binding domain-containing protein [Spirosomataceae bacterium]
MINCIAIDDEPLALRLLQDNISKVPYLQLIATCTDAFEAMQALSNQKIHLIFADIQLPGLSGLQLIDSLENRPMVIFITAYKQYALEGFDLAVVDYLVKPVALERFFKACNRAKDLYDLRHVKTQASSTLPPDYFFVQADYSQVKVVFQDISLIEGLGDYIKIYLKSTTRPLVVRTSIKSIENELPVGKFIRIHKSFLVAIAEITAIRKNSVFLGNKEFPIGETYRESIEKLVQKG